jgi:crotonobetainyl-CoA:carnitine CoA-transferase CaiB-like acyl-CoA transferase
VSHDNVPGALAGLRVIDLTRVLGGPYCTQILGDHGADVIKIESPQGDETREWGPPFEEGTAAYYLGVNRNKRSAVLDLSHEQGRQILLTLLEGADVLVENFKTGTLEKWGIGGDLLRQKFPRLIHCRVSGFGADGPLGGFPGYDAVIQAMAGLMSVNGAPDGGPTRIGVPIVDLVTGLNATLGILLALQARHESGQGQFVETALFDCGVSVLHPYMANFLYSGNRPKRSGNAHPNICPYDVFRTATSPLFLAVGNDRQFRILCDRLGRPELATDSRFLKNADRCAHRDTLKETLEALLSEKDGTVLFEELVRAGVPCGPVLSIDEVAVHPHVLHREMLVELDGYRGTGSPIKLSRTPASYRRRPPRLGEHTDEILGKP